MTDIACTAATCARTLLATELAAGQTLCTPCVDALRAWLGHEIPLQMTVLEGSRQRETTGSAAGGRTVHATAPLPGRADVLNLIGPAPWAYATRDPYGDAHGDQHGTLPIAGILTPWARLIAEESRWDPPASLTPQGLAAWLARPRPLAWASRRVWAGDYRDELHELMRTIRHTTRLRPQRRPITQPCPRCDSLTLVQTDHQLYTECTQDSCGGLFTRDELALAARLAVAALDTDAA
ncbi:hypothetical protein PV396_24535 [Streptomyces sp. ME02-8801-2C]|uniref:hypothetical protein n=1 Tax=Streptomyces sp. ME02-8801-2C TaxID=3028680 RepID=UPI0029B42EEB|nr:hypothetical protein [Streptomyces sp. ME02-8801-2C]MDX3455070.1 hypothetical protein [Streptomyces sp. ME02-8801-2C]